MSEAITFAAPLAFGLATATPREYSKIVSLLLSITGLTTGIVGIMMALEDRQEEAQVVSTAGAIFSLFGILSSLDLA